MERFGVERGGAHGAFRHDRAEETRGAPDEHHAREEARSFLEALPEPSLAAGAADTVNLIVSELVTNALRNGGGTSA